MGGCVHCQAGLGLLQVLKNLSRIELSRRKGGESVQIISRDKGRLRECQRGVSGAWVPKWEVGAARSASSSWKGETDGPHGSCVAWWPTVKAPPGMRLPPSPWQPVGLAQAGPDSWRGVPQDPREPVLQGVLGWELRGGAGLGRCFLP